MWINVSTVEKTHSAVLKKRDNSYSDVSNIVFYTHTCKIFGSGQGSTATYSCFSSFGNLSFCKMLPVMPLSRNGKHEAVPRILAIGAINESQLFRWGLGLTTYSRVRSRRSSCHLNESQKRLRLTNFQETEGQGADLSPIPKAPMLIHATIKAFLFSVIKLF